MSGDDLRNRPSAKRSSGKTTVRPANVRSSAAGNSGRTVSKKPAKRINAETVDIRRSNIKHKRYKKELSYAPARKKLFLLGHEGDVDVPFVIIVLALLVTGVLMMFSAGYFWALDEYNDANHYLRGQLQAAFPGVIIMYIISKVDYHAFQNTMVTYGFFLTIFVLNLYTAFFGVERAGARRWISIAGINFQPSELLKLAMIIALAYLLSANYPKFKFWKFSTLPCVIILGACAGLMVFQRHMSALVILGVIALMMLFVGGVPKKHFLVLTGILVGLGVLFLAFKMATSSGSDAGFGYITNRLKAWRNPELDVRNTTYQIHNSLIAISSGGLFGQGLGESKQKYLWLSEAQNDFVFSIVCEELGMVGALAVLGLFCFFIFRGFTIATRAGDRFGMLLASGITMQIGLQALLNIAVATNTIPNTGISLPFFSYGGTALLIQLTEVGILLSVSRKTHGFE